MAMTGRMPGGISGSGHGFLKAKQKHEIAMIGKCQPKMRMMLQSWQFCMAIKNQITCI